MVSTAVVMNISLQKFKSTLSYGLMNHSLSRCIEWTREDNTRGGKKKTHVKILRFQKLQHKIRDENLKQYKDEMKVSLYGIDYGLDPIFELE